MSISVINIGVRCEDGYIRVLCTLNNFNEELDKYEFDALIDQVLQTYQSVGVAAEVFVIDMFQKSSEYLYIDPYPPAKTTNRIAA